MNKFCLWFSVALVLISVVVAISHEAAFLLIHHADDNCLIFLQISNVNPNFWIGIE
jgi:hypothetical protein